MRLISALLISSLTLTAKALSFMEITSLKLHTSHLPANEAALQRCKRALELKDKGEYDAAQAVMRPLWQRLGDHPDVTGLHESVAAEVLLCVGILTGWIGSRNAVKEADRVARDLITQSIAIYEAAGDMKMVAAARSELAYCYWREGSLDEARIFFNGALDKLTAAGNTRANALLGLAVVEWTASRYSDALEILTDNTPLFKRIPNHTIKGFYHNTLAMVLRKLTTPENRQTQLRRIISEYKEADLEFTAAHNTVFRAHVKNNVASMLREMSRLKEAMQYLDQARRLTVSVRDRVRTAQVDWSRAQVMIEQGKFKQAEKTARLAVVSFERSGRNCLLVEALITRGIALARMGNTDAAQFSFQKAIEVAQQVGALNEAGLAALTLIEELGDLPPQILAVAYERATEWLAETQSQDLLRRMMAAASKVLARMQSELTVEPSTDALSNKPVDFDQELLNSERVLIRRALAQVNGSVTRAAQNLSISYQKLGYIIETRHRDLLTERSPVRRRPRKPPRSNRVD